MRNAISAKHLEGFIESKSCSSMELAPREGRRPFFIGGFDAHLSGGFDAHLFDALPVFGKQVRLNDP